MFYRVESIGKQTLFKSFISHVLKQQILISLHKYLPESAFNLICKYLHDFATDYFYVLNKLLKKIVFCSHKFMVFIIFLNLCFQ